MWNHYNTKEFTAFYLITDEQYGSWEELEEQERKNEKMNPTQRFLVATNTSEKFKDSLPKFIYVFKKENAERNEEQKQTI